MGEEARRPVALLALALGLLLALAALGLLLSGSEPAAEPEPAAAVGSSPTPRPPRAGPPRPAAASPAPLAAPSAAPSARPSASPSAAASPAPDDPRPAARSLLVTGRVEDPSGAPAPGAAVFVWLAHPHGEPAPQAVALDRDFLLLDETTAVGRGGGSPELAGRVTTDAAGGFVATLPHPRAALRLSVRWRRGAREHHATRALALPEGDALDAGAVRLRALPALRFLIRDQGGAPLTGAQVEVFHSVTPPGWRSPSPEPVRDLLLSDERGRAACALSADGASFTVSAEGHATEHGFTRLAGDGAEVTVQLEPAARASGRVVGPDGAPLAGAVILACERQSAEEEARVGRDEAFRLRVSARALSDAQGRFELEGLAAGRRYELSLIPPLRDPPLLGQARDLTPPAQDLLLSARVGLTLRATGRLPAGARRRGELGFVLQRRLERDGSWHDQLLQRVASDEPLELRCGRLPEGVYRVALFAERYAPVVSEALELRADRPPPEPTLALEAPGRSVRGQVLDPAGKPLPDVVVQWTDFGTIYTQTDLDGRFLLEGLPAGALTLALGKAGFAPRALEVPAGAEEVAPARLQPAQ
ncbi:MAG: carboxypeptidase regulatory-like domain-containing protein [Planctomycetota bacterium]